MHTGQAAICVNYLQSRFSLAEPVHYCWLCFEVQAISITAIGDFLLFGGGGGKLVGCFVSEVAFAV